MKKIEIKISGIVPEWLDEQDAIDVISAILDYSEMPNKESFNVELIEKEN